MPCVLRMRMVFAAVVVSFLLGVPVFAQMETATLSGVVQDPKGAVVPDVDVVATRIETGTSMTTKTNGAGIYFFTGLMPGHYHLQVRKPGFKEIAIKSFELLVQDKLEQNFSLEIGSVSESVTVNADDLHMNTTDASVSTVIDQRLMRELPLNGRSFQSLFQLTPGVTVTPTNVQSEGQFSVNGQRTNANYFTIDGASANANIVPSFQGPQTFGGSLPAFSALGGTNSLVSVDAVREFAVQTSSYAPEFGRSPGAQISIVTRSGTNQFHGTAFEYLRNDVFDANDWFANRDGLKRAALRQNDFGGVFGGPIFKEKTFFFFSYEGLRLRQPTTGQSDVPSLAVRQAAPLPMQPFFNAYPLPTGPDEGNGLAPANYAFSNPATLDASSLRIDHRFSQSLSIFGRYNYAPSSSQVRGGGVQSLNTAIVTAEKAQTLTLGLTKILTPFLDTDARFNWTQASASSTFRLDTFGGAAPLSVEPLLPSFCNGGQCILGVFLSLDAQLGEIESGVNAANQQHQLNFIDTVNWQHGAHLFKLGVDYRRLTPEFNPAIYLQQAAFADPFTAFTQQVTAGQAQHRSPVTGTFTNYSLFVQDTWKVTGRLTATYGIRWDDNPAPQLRSASGLRPVVISGASTTSPLIANGGLYNSTTNNIAPRLGLAFKLRDSPNGQTVLRAGAGIFYDLGTGSAGYALQNAPFSNRKPIAPGSLFPYSATDAAPTPLSQAPPFSRVLAFPSTLRLPYVYQWNLSAEQSLGKSQTLTIGYLGAKGHSLLRTSVFTASPNVPAGVSSVLYADNSGYSTYNALQTQFRRHATRQLDLIASYTWSHSLDNVSTDANPTGIPGQFISPSRDYAASDFDIRHTFSLAGDYELPTRLRSRVASAFLNGWAVDPILTARSSPPVDVEISRDLGFGTYNFRPDVVAGVPTYVRGSAFPGGRGINPQAFAVAPTAVQGNLSRNSLRGFPLFQADLALKRRFKIREAIALQFGLEAFNLLNHPTFAPPANTLGTVTPTGQLILQNGFGVSQSMLGRGLAGSDPGSGFNPLYQIGGPRSLQLSLKLQF